MKDKHTRTSRGFTLIELLIVIGIIALLTSVLAVAVLPMIMKADETALNALLEDVGPKLQGLTIKPTQKKFKKDAGSLSGQISGDKDIANSQMILFYLAPDSDTWDQSRLYKDKPYSPLITPETWQANIIGDKTLKYLADQNGDPFRYILENGKVMLLARGEDGKFKTADDIIYDGRSGSVKTGEEVKFK